MREAKKETKKRERREKRNKQNNHYMLFYRTPHSNQHTHTPLVYFIFQQFQTKTVYPITDIRLCLNMNIGNINTGTSVNQCWCECVCYCVCARDWGELKA